MELIFDNIHTIFLKQKQKLPKKIAVAVSGGCDSLALTFALREFCAAKKIELFAITIDHAVRKNSTEESLQLQKLLTKNKINHEILKINWANKPEKNIEASLRQERYKLLTNFCKKNKIKFLFLGHHLGDSAENFLIRLFRGSGLDGLSTMANFLEVSGVKLVRPMLDIAKEELQNYLKTKKIKWFEDETNDDERFLRNKIRNFFATFEEKNLIQKRIKNACDEISEMRDFIDVVVEREMKKVVKFADNSCAIDVKKFKKLNPKIALKILALITMKIGGKEYKPRLAKLKKFYDWILFDEKHKRRDFYGCRVELRSCLIISATMMTRERKYSSSLGRSPEDLGSLALGGFAS